MGFTNDFKLYEHYPTDDKAGCMRCPAFQYCDEIQEFEEQDYKPGQVPKKWKDAGEVHQVSSHKIKSVVKGGKGPWRVMIVGEAPGAEEDAKNTLFIGGSGKFLNTVLQKVGIKKYVVTNVFKCRPPDNETPTFAVAKKCAPFLAEEIHKYRPDVIVPLGKAAYSILRGSGKHSISKDVGVVSEVTLHLHDDVEDHRVYIFPMNHPAYILRKPEKSDEYTRNFVKLRNFLDDPRTLKSPEDFDILGVTDERSLKRAIRRFNKTKSSLLAFDIETNRLSPHYPDSDIISISFSFNRKSAIVFPMRENKDAPFYKKKLGVIKQLLTDPGWGKIAHNGKFDRLWVWKYWGFRPRPMAADTLLAHYGIVTETKGTHGLKKLSADLLNFMNYDVKGNVQEATGADKQAKSVLDYSVLDDDMLIRYNGMDTIATMGVHHELMYELRNKKGKERKFRRALVNFLNQASDAFLDVERNGMKVDLDIAHEVLNYYQKKRSEAKWDMNHLKKVVNFKNNLPEKTKFNINSSKQLRTLLFDKKYFGFPPQSFTARGEEEAETQGWTSPQDPEVPLEFVSTNAETLTALSNLKNSEICQKIMDFRLYEKLIGTYLEPYIERASCNIGNYINARFNLHVTSTGRSSSEDPNFQNIPNKSQGDIKRLIVSRFRSGIIVSQDYSQIELRILASLSQDPVMLDSYRSGEDLHRKTALAILNMTNEEYETLPKHEQKKWRTVAKRINFGIAYGTGPGTIVSLLHSENIFLTLTDDDVSEMKRRGEIPQEDFREAKDIASGYIDAFYNLYPEVENYIERVRNHCERRGSIKSVMGRTRNLPEAQYTWDRDAQERALRQGVNFTIQSVASDITLTSLILVRNYTKRHFKKSVRLFASIHDAIDADAKLNVAYDYIESTKEIMEDVPRYSEDVWQNAIDWEFYYRLPIEVSSEVGWNWRDCIEIEDIIEEDESYESAFNRALEISGKKRKERDFMMTHTKLKEPDLSEIIKIEEPEPEKKG